MIVKLRNHPSVEATRFLEIYPGMNPNLTNLANFLEAKEMSIEVDAALGRVHCSFRLQHIQVNLWVRMGEDSEHFVVIVPQPALVPPERRPDVAEFLHRANQSLHLGAFEMDFNDGEVRFRLGLMLEDDGIATDSFWRRVLLIALGTSDSMFAVLMQVTLNRMPPATASEQFEAAMEISFSSTTDDEA